MPVVYTSVDGAGYFGASNVAAASAITDPTAQGDYSEVITAVSAILDVLEAHDIVAPAS